jgi:hypothetical protein
MCVSDTAGIPNSPAPSADPLEQVLLADAQATPKVSIPVGAIEILHKKKKVLFASLGVEKDENQAYHLTSQEPFISSNQAIGDDIHESGTAVALSGLAAVTMKVTPPTHGGAAGFDVSELWKIGLSILPLFLGAATASSDPHVTLGIAVSGSSASIVEYSSSAAAKTDLAGTGINVGCLISAGGASILTTIVACLPALSSGTQAFREALMKALGPAGVDLITNVMECFRA